jgi:hypothetical protein
VTPEEKILRALLRVRVALGSLQDACDDTFPEFPDVRELAEAAIRLTDGQIREVMRPPERHG